MKFNLGDKVRDKVTGLEGIVVGRTEWLSGCDVMTVQPQQLKDGKAVEVSAFDEPRLELVKANAMEELDRTVGGNPTVPARGH